jgi:hypothetical protein
MSFIITPEYFVSLETNIQSIMVDRWAEFAADPRLSYWDSLTEEKTTATREEIWEWQINQSKLRRQVDQANRRYDDLYSWAWAMQPDDIGDNLILREKDIEDNKVDHVGQWASDVGGAWAYWPQETMIQLFAAGETELCYDGVPFFSSAHPIVPGIAGSGTFPNLFTGKPLNFANLRDGVAAIRNIKGPRGVSRFLYPYRLLHTNSNQSNALEILTALNIGDDTTAGRSGSKNNVITQYGFDAPLCMQDHPDNGEWYLQCKVLSAPFKMPFIRLMRKALEVNTFAASSQVELNRSKSWEYNADARVSMGFGEPSALFKFKP